MNRKYERKQHFQKLLTLFLSVSLVTGAMPVTAFGAEKYADTKTGSVTDVSAGEVGNDVGDSVSSEEPAENAGGIFD